jgi:hypothetical protein
LEIPMIQPTSLDLFHIFWYPYLHSYWGTIDYFLWRARRFHLSFDSSSVRNLKLSASILTFGRFRRESSLATFQDSHLPKIVRSSIWSHLSLDALNGFYAGTLQFDAEGHRLSMSLLIAGVQN